MHWLDTTLLAALCVGAVLGFVTGLFWQLARIASFVLAVYATIFLHDAAVDVLRGSVLRELDGSIVGTAAYLTVFLLAYLLLFLVTRLLRSWIRSTDLAPLDRLLGAALGLGKVALVLAVVCWTMSRWPHPGPKEWHDASTLAALFARGVDSALIQIPDAYKQPILETFEQWRSGAGKV